MRVIHALLPVKFQSTLSLRRATPSPGSSPGLLPNFNPRSPCGERPRSHSLVRVYAGFQSTLSLRRATTPGLCRIRPAIISIHALLAESDEHSLDILPASLGFQSTLSLRRATVKPLALNNFYLFQSTLSLRRATRSTGPEIYQRHFNPRSPCGERHGCAEAGFPRAGFQSTLSLRRATANTTKLALSFLSKVPI